MKKSDAPIYQIKVTLEGSEPPIWRQILVPGKITLADLHETMQIVMGWHNSHLHAFEIEGNQYSKQEMSFFQVDDFEMEDSSRVRLADVITEAGQTFTYEYDFGDSWQHILLVEKILPPDPKQTLPVCIAGERACPLEDIGGIWGYMSFLEAIQDPTHEEHENLKEWMSEMFDIDRFDPEAFDLKAVNNVLKKRKLKF